MKFCVYNNEIDTKRLLKIYVLERRLKISIEENAIVPFISQY